MGVVVEDDADACGVGVKVEVVEVVEHVDEAAAEFHGFGGGEVGAGAGGVDVSADGSGGCDAAELGEDVGVAYVTGVQDVIDASECAGRSSGRRRLWVSERTPMSMLEQ